MAIITNIMTFPILVDDELDLKQDADINNSGSSTLNLEVNPYQSSMLNSYLTSSETNDNRFGEMSTYAEGQIIRTEDNVSINPSGYSTELLKEELKTNQFELTNDKNGNREPVAEGEELLCFNIPEEFRTPKCGGSQIEIEYSWQDLVPNQGGYSIACYLLDNLNPNYTNIDPDPAIVSYMNIEVDSIIPRIEKRNGEYPLCVPLCKGAYQIVLLEVIKHQSDRGRIVAKGVPILTSLGLMVEWNIKFEGENLVVTAENTKNVKEFGHLRLTIVKTKDEGWNYKECVDGEGNSYYYGDQHTVCDNPRKKTVVLPVNKIRELLGDSVTAIMGSIFRGAKTDPILLHK